MKHIFSWQISEGILNIQGQNSGAAEALSPHSKQVLSLTQAFTHGFLPVATSCFPPTIQRYAV